MTAITQTIPNLVSGISQQPDELMFPGQLKDAKNVFLDVTSGLVKRPGAQLVGSAISDVSAGKWFAIDRDANEQYVGRIKTTGEVELWSALDGTPRIVKYQSVPYKDPNKVRQSFLATLEAVNAPAQPISASCSVSGFNTARVEYKEALAALDAKRAEIDSAELNLSNARSATSCQQYWRFVHTRRGLFPYDIQGYVILSNGSVREYNRPASNANTTVSVGNYIQDIKTQQLSANIKIGNGGAPPRPEYGKLYAYQVCYTDPYLTSLYASQVANIASLKSQLPALEGAIVTKRAAYVAQAAACGIYISPYQQISGNNPYIFLSVTSNTPLENVGPAIPYKFERLGDTSGTTTVYYTVGGTATINVDYTITGDNTGDPTQANRIVTFNAGEESKIVNVNPIGDTTFEGDETISFQIKSDNSYSTVTTVPVYSAILNDDVQPVGSLLPYLQHSVPTDLSLLTINDYTFIANRNSTGLLGPGPVSMSSSNLPVRPYEAFVAISQVAYGKQYALDFNYYGTGQSAQTVSSAESLDVATSNWTGDDGACPYSDSDVFDVAPSTGSANPDADWITTVEGYRYYNNGGTWTKANVSYPDFISGGIRLRSNLRFELVTTGQQVPKDYADASKGYYCRYTTEATLEVAGEGWKVGDKVQVTMNGRKYEIKVTKVRSTEVFGSAGIVRPTATSTNAATVLQASQVLSDIKTAIDSTTTGFTTEIIGNGIYITHSKPFTVSTPEAQLMNVFTDSINNISRLPTQCKDGYIVKVLNSASDEDDYYLKFVCKQGSQTKTGATINQTGIAPTTGNVTTKGEGVWEETTKPGIKTSFNSSTMPHQLVRTPDGTFIVSPVDWEERLVGDDESNPLPTFVGSFIQGMVLFRNRLVFLTDENIVMSRPGDYFNFFAESAIAISAKDPVDIAVGSSKPAALRVAYPTKSGLVVFSDSEQFYVFSSDDVLGPDTARLSSLSNYKFNSKTTPVGLGTSIAFLGDTGKNSAMYEIVEIPNSNEAKIIEQSKLVSSLLPDTIDQIISTKDNSAIFLGTTGSNEVWVFRYFETGEKRIQGAWFRWELTGELLHHFFLSDGYYVVLKNTESIANKEVVTIQRFDLKKQEWSSIVQNADSYEFNVHLDNAKLVYSTQMTYDANSDTTSFYLPFAYYSDKQLRVYSLSSGEYAGLAATPTITVNPDVDSGQLCTLDGDWTTTRLLIGYVFEMDVKLPILYKQTVSGDSVSSDTRGSLIIHRLKINFGDSGIYETTIKRLGHDDYTEEYAVPLYDQYEVDTVALKERYTQTVPIYSRNTDTTINIKSSHPSPATIFSINWEGDYNDRYYRRV